MADQEVYNPLGNNGKGDFDLVSTGGGSGSDPFITDGSVGITNIRFQSSGAGLIYDMTVDDSGAVVTSLVNMTSGSPYGLLLALTKP